jgi:hypothetical protein
MARRADAPVATFAYTASDVYTEVSYYILSRLVTYRARCTVHKKPALRVLELPQLDRTFIDTTQQVLATLIGHCCFT